MNMFTVRISLARSPFVKNMIKKILKNKNLNIKRGYIVLMSVLIFGAVSLAIIISIIMLGMSSSRTSFAFNQSVQSEVLATACLEEAMQEIVDTSILNSSSTLSFDLGNCSYETTSQDGQNIMIQSTGFSGTIVKKIKVLISTTTPVITTSFWQEVDNF